MDTQTYTKEEVIDLLNDLLKEIKEYGSVWMEYTRRMTKEKIAEEALHSSKEAIITIIENKINTINNEEMTKLELIEMFENQIFPKQAENFLKLNYEGKGELDKQEYLRDTAILISLAKKGLSKWVINR